MIDALERVWKFLMENFVILWEKMLEIQLGIPIIGFFLLGLVIKLIVMLRKEDE